MEGSDHNINWIPAEPRSGILGAWDKFVGTGATSEEEQLQIIGTVVLTVLIGIVIYTHRDTLNWTTWQVLFAGLFAFDLSGGVITNATSAAKRWYHRRGQEGLQHHLPFVAVHGFHLFIVAALFRQMDWAYFLGCYAYLLIAAIIILKTPLYLQRPLSLMLFCGAILLGVYIFTPTPGLEWFIPFFYLKLLVSHLVKEAPFTPDSQSGSLSK